MKQVNEHDITPGAAEHHIIMANESNKYQMKYPRISVYIYHINVSGCDTRPRHYRANALMDT